MGLELGWRLVHGAQNARPREMETLSERDPMIAWSSGKPIEVVRSYWGSGTWKIRVSQTENTERSPIRRGKIA